MLEIWSGSVFLEFLKVDRVVLFFSGENGGCKLVLSAFNLWIDFFVLLCWSGLVGSLFLSSVTVMCFNVG